MSRSVLFIILIIILGACNHKPSPNTAALVHAYVYYPKPNVYYDTTQKAFIYFDSSAANWKTGNLPVNLQADMGKSVLIPNPTTPVWNNNKEHRLIYSATLYADSEDFKKQHPRETHPVISKPAHRTVEDNSSHGEEAGRKKEHHKVGDFLRKIFGKKKKDD